MAILFANAKKFIIIYSFYASDREVAEAVSAAKSFPRITRMALILSANGF